MIDADAVAELIGLVNRDSIDGQIHTHSFPSLQCG